MQMRRRLMGFAPVILLALLLVGALKAQKQTGEAAPAATSDTTNVAARTTQEKQDSLFALLDQEFGLIKPIIEHSCYDCHSNATKYPWYHSLPLVKGMIDKDIATARRRVDFSDGFPFAGKPPILEILRDIRDEIREGDMPPWDYRLMHWGKLIEGAKRDSVFAWLDSSISRIEGFYDAEKIPYKKDTVRDTMESED